MIESPKKKTTISYKKWENQTWKPKQKWKANENKDEYEMACWKDQNLQKKERDREKREEGNQPTITHKRDGRKIKSRKENKKSKTDVAISLFIFKLWIVKKCCSFFIVWIDIPTKSQNSHRSQIFSKSLILWSKF